MASLVSALLSDLPLGVHLLSAPSLSAPIPLGPLSVGTVTILVSIVVLLLWIPLRQRPGPGTIVNALGVGPAVDVTLLVLPAVEALWLRALLFAIGLTVLAAATGLYIGARFGPGPRDGLMTGLHERTGRPIWLVRTAIEVSVVAVGWALGGGVGIGTLAFALLVGPLCQVFLRVFAVPESAPIGLERRTGPLPIGG